MSTKGKIIFLNGTSSAGKTTLAGELQNQLREPYQHICIDQFVEGIPGPYRGMNSPQGSTGHLGINVVPVQQGDDWVTEVQFGQVGQKILSGMHRSVAAMADMGVNVIVDDLCLNRLVLPDYLKVLEGYHVFFVGVRCPVEEINKREAARWGRFPGTARGQLMMVHLHGLYDYEVDTSVRPSHLCAEELIQQFESNATPQAFAALRQRMDARGSLYGA